MTNTRTIILTPARLLALRLACLFRFDRSSAFYGPDNKGGIFAGVHVVHSADGLRIEATDRAALFSAELPLESCEHRDEIDSPIDVVMAADATTLPSNPRDDHAFPPLGGDS